MRVPLSWLREYVNVDVEPKELARRLTMAGVEVAGVEYIGKRPSKWEEAGEVKHFSLSWEGIYVGEIIEVKPHPNADRLVVALVNYGAAKPVATITAAPNIRVGEGGCKVALAEVGARLIDPYSDEPKLFKVRSAKIRGLASQAVICSEKELGLSDDHTEVLILDDDAPVGAPLFEVIGDVVLDLDLTPNLARCLSIIGVAREVAATTGQKIKLKEPALKLRGSDPIEIEIKDPKLCPRYSAALIKGVEVKQSPFWMRHRLLLAGMRPINNIVDITNHVMLEWGQPLHAFDYDKLLSRADKVKITVRCAKQGERITTLDGVEHELSQEMLIITDEAGPIAIAGVMGGLETEVTQETKNILLESANFDNINNRSTSSKLKLQSEASTRFGRGIPPEFTIPALKRAGELMSRLAGGVASQIADSYPLKQPQRKIELRPGEVKRILGMEIPSEEIIRILKSLEFECEHKKSIHVKVPPHRLDVEISADLIEEVARIVGYEKIPATLMKDELPPQRRNRDLEIEERIRDILAGCGLTEVITYSLTNLKSVAKLQEVQPNEYLKVANPLKEREYLRKTLLVGLLETVSYNQRHSDRIAIFEIGRVYLSLLSKRPKEPRRLGIALWGIRPFSWLEEKEEEMGFFDLKGVVEALADQLGLEFEFKAKISKHPSFHPGRLSEVLLAEEPIGILGEAHPKVAESFDIKGRVCMAELDLDQIIAKARAEEFSLSPIPRFPAVVEDIAVVVDEAVPASKVQEVILKAGGGLLKETVLFDLYVGKQVPKGKKSLTYSLVYQAEDRTLTDEEVHQIRQSIQKQLKEELDAVLRGLEEGGGNA